MRSLVAGNWKMNGLKAESLELASDLAGRARSGAVCDVLVCPPSTMLSDVGAVISGSGIMLGGQDCHALESGAHTGDVSPVMLADLGCSHAIVGHSERRANHGESDAVVTEKAAAAHKAGLTAIICLGENAAERVEGRAKEIVTLQLHGSLPEGASAANTVIAYEPVWAIGTGNTATPQDVTEIHDHLRGELTRAFGDDGNAVRLLYGGSVNAGNASELLAVDNVNGALVGGASLKPDDFWAIVESGRPD